MPSTSAPKRQKTNWPCVVCGLNCGVGSISCDNCNCWMHAKCDGLTSDDLKTISGQYPYECRVCIRTVDGGVYNYESAMNRLNTAASFSIDHLRVMAKREKQLLPPLRLDHHQLDQAQHSIDFTALGYLEHNADKDSQTYRPLLTTGDGNCLFNALSIGLCGAEYMCCEIKVRTCIEMACNELFYITQNYSKDFLLCSPSFVDALMNCAKIGAYSSAWTIQAASNALNCNINALYPKVNGPAHYIAQLLTRTHAPQSTNETTKSLGVLWSRIGFQGGRIWLPNHFVALVSCKSETVSTPSKSLNGIDFTCEESCIPADPFVTDEDNLEQTQRLVLDITMSSDTAYVRKETLKKINTWGSQNGHNDFEYHAASSITDIVDNSEASEHTKEMTNIPEITGIYPLTGGKPLTAEEVINIIVSDIPTVKQIPTGIKQNVYVVLDNKNNTERRKEHNCKPAQYWDDCGVWDSKKGRVCRTKYLIRVNGKDKLCQVIVKEDLIYTETHEAGTRKIKLLQPQPPLSQIITFVRYYATLKRKPNYEKRVTWIQGLKCRDVAIVEYTGEYDDTLVQHGNAKMCSDGYERTNPQVMDKIRELAEYQKPSDVYAKITDPSHNISVDYPRDLRQCQNIKAEIKAENKTKGGSHNVADELLDVLRMMSEQHPYVAEVIHSRDNALPAIICYTEEQLVDLKSFLESGAGVVGIDRTFSLGKCFVTTAGYKSHKVLRKITGEPPILLGPLLLHWDGRQQNYFRFFSHLRGVLGIELKNVEILMGTDDEKAMVNAIDLAFPDCKRKLCTKHIKDNLIRQMTEKIPKNTKERTCIVDMMFGSNGVATANDSATFDERNRILKTKLSENKQGDFLSYYERYIEEKIAKHVVSGDDQMWTNNNTESMNHRIKVLLNWQPRKTNELIEKIYELIKVQLVDLRRSLYGTGNYSLSTKFSRCKISKISWNSKSEEEKDKIFMTFLQKSNIKLTTTVTSSDGMYTVLKAPKLAKKKNQRTRCRATKTSRK